jgi:choline dehydrogenase-like flavoprotein
MSAYDFFNGDDQRISQETFEHSGSLEWPLTSQDLEIYLREAEYLLYVHGDIDSDVGRRGYKIPGQEYWKNWIEKYFGKCSVTPEAKNISRSDGKLGRCVGRGHCAICESDAKARPDTCFGPFSTLENTYVKRINFERDEAVSILAMSEGEEVEVSADRFILAAGGLENVALLRRSNLPQGVNAQGIGRFYQDHTACELLVKVPIQIEHYKLGTEAHFELEDISGYYDGIEIKCLLLSVPLEPEQLKRLILKGESTLRSAALGQTLASTARIYLQIEIPPEWCLELSSGAQGTYIKSINYIKHLGIIDLAVIKVKLRLAELGIQVLDIYPHYRSYFGGHHYSGTTAMSRGMNAVVDENQKLIGTNNIYINGASVIPRCGASGPTLTLTALGLRLGSYLARNHSH